MTWNGERIKALRGGYAETQEQFRQRLGVSLATLKFWELDRGEPLGPAQILLDRLAEDLKLGNRRELIPA